MMASSPTPVLRVDLAHDQRDFGVHAPRVGVVDHGRATRGRFGRELERYVASGREEGDIDALERFGSRLPHRQSPPTSADGRTGGPAGREQPELANREMPF